MTEPCGSKSLKKIKRICRMVVLCTLLWSLLKRYYTPVKVPLVTLVSDSIPSVEIFAPHRISVAPSYALSCKWFLYNANVKVIFIASINHSEQSFCRPLPFSLRRRCLNVPILLRRPKIPSCVNHVQFRDLQGRRNAAGTRITNLSLLLWFVT